MATRHHLPIPLTPLIGREDELANIAANIRGGSMRLVTLTGPGGIGKSRLALELAHQLSQDFAAGCAWVSLASVHDPDHVAAALASSLDVQVPAGRSALSALCDDLANQDKLLVIDNFEQVSDAAPVLAELLQAGSSLRIIVTSRSVLNISGEHRVAVGPLALPDEQEFRVEDPQDPEALADGPHVLIGEALRMRPEVASLKADAEALKHVALNEKKQSMPTLTATGVGAACA